MSALNDDRKSGPGIRTKLNTVRDRAMAAGEVAEHGAGKAQFAQRRAEVQPDESKPEGDAVDAVEETGQELVDDAEHIGEAAVHRIGEAVHRGRESERKQDDGEGIQPEDGERDTSREDFTASQDVTGQSDPQRNEQANCKADGPVDRQADGKVDGDTPPDAGSLRADTKAESPIEINWDDEAAAGRQENLCQPQASHKDTSQTVQPCANESEIPDSSLQS